MQIYRLMRWSGWLTLLAYIALRWNSQPTLWSELLLYNVIPLLSAILIIISPIPDDKYARIGIFAAIALWTSGSVAASIDSFFQTNFDIYSQSAYLLFYPLAIFGIARALRQRNQSRTLELLDTIIIALSGTGLVSLFMIKAASNLIDGSSLDIFLTIVYPVADSVLLLTVLTFLFLNEISKRNLLIVLGVTFYTGSDLIFLWRTITSTYVYGELSDVLWLIGFLLIAEAMRHKPNEMSKARSFTPLTSTFALLLSLAIVLLLVLSPGFLPPVALIPSVMTIALTFIRMIVANRDAHHLSDEQLLARTDELTGLANRRRFLAEFESFKEGVGSLLILDLDGFKPVNDSLGHEAGDELLRQVARRLERVMPRGSLLARLGGDEFGALIPGVDAHEVAYALRATLAYPFTISGNSIQLDVSIGEAVNEPDSANSDSLLRRADEAMYRAKKLRAGVLRWEPSIMSSRD